MADSAQMPTREQMIADLQSQAQGQMPSREQMIKDLQGQEGPSWADAYSHRKAIPFTSVPVVWHKAHSLRSPPSVR